MDFGSLEKKLLCAGFGFSCGVFANLAVYGAGLFANGAPIMRCIKESGMYGHPIIYGVVGAVGGYLFGKWWADDWPIDRGDDLEND